MMQLSESLGSLWNTIFHIIQNITIIDILDIMVFSVVLYFVYKYIRDKRAVKLAVGVVLLVLIYVISGLIGMRTMNFIMQNLFQVGILALVILFQPEFRSLLEKVGTSSIMGIKGIGDARNEDSVQLAVREVVTAADEMAKSKTGALIVFQRTTQLGDIVSTGSIIDAKISSFLIRNIFFNNAPLHDGAVVVVNSRIYAAGCLLPLSAQNDINRDLGTRHRAALGLSENSDAVVVVVSEETGIISVASEGKLLRGFTGESLRLKLNELLLGEAVSGKAHQRQVRKHRGKKAKKEDKRNV